MILKKRLLAITMIVREGGGKRSSCYYVEGEDVVVFVYCRLYDNIVMSCERML